MTASNRCSTDRWLVCSRGASGKETTNSENDWNHDGGEIHCVSFDSYVCQTLSVYTMRSPVLIRDYSEN